MKKTGHEDSSENEFIFANGVCFISSSGKANTDLTFGIGVVGITQSPPSINHVVYMLYSYAGRSFIFGRALVSLVIPRYNWPEDHEFVSYCLKYKFSVLAHQM